jgi:hypothetical protein
MTKPAATYVTITAVRKGTHITTPARDSTGFVGGKAPADGLCFTLRDDGGCFFVAATGLQLVLDTLHAPPAAAAAAAPAEPSSSPPPMPGELWKQANGNRKRYLALMTQHGYLYPKAKRKRRR